MSWKDYLDYIKSNVQISPYKTFPSHTHHIIINSTVAEPVPKDDTDKHQMTTKILKEFLERKEPYLKMLTNTKYLKFILKVHRITKTSPV